MVKEHRSFANAKFILSSSNKIFSGAIMLITTNNEETLKALATQYGVFICDTRCAKDAGRFDRN